MMKSRKDEPGTEQGLEQLGEGFPGSEGQLKLERGVNRGGEQQKKGNLKKKCCWEGEAL